MAEGNNAMPAGLPALGDPLGVTGEEAPTNTDTVPPPTIHPLTITIKYTLDGKSYASAPSAIIPWSDDYHVILAASKKALRRCIPSTSEADDYWLAVLVGDDQAAPSEITPDAFANTLKEHGTNLFLCGGVPEIVSKPLDIYLLPPKNTTATENFYTFEIMAIGDSGVGKTRFLRYFITGKSKPVPSSTQSDNWVVQRFRMKSNQNAIVTSLWDTVGHEKHNAFTNQALRRISGVFLMYDITREDTFLSCTNWLAQTRQRLRPGAQIVLVGNHLDQDAQRNVGFSTAQDFASQHGWPFIETSGLSGANVEAAFQLLVQEMLTQFKRNGTLEQYFKSSKTATGSVVDLSDESQNRWAWYKPWTWSWVRYWFSASA